ncbi:hypothetical protein Q5P01_014707 [Channa striata]|uniref:Uncharacterized protein n=1 Tax=Channa striata TaxID=64152 RepID=A0AA88MHQ4_CHASR|nr:hypothetical protein Q5P01_014707 [Channa striata]
MGAMARKLGQTLSSHAAFYHCGLFVGSSQGLGGLGDQRGTKWGLCLNDLDSGRQNCGDTKISSTVITRYPVTSISSEPPRAHGTLLLPCPALSGDVCLCQEPQLVGRVPNH